MVTLKQGDFWWRPLSGIEQKEHVLERLEKREGEWLRRARQVMVELLMDGAHEVSSDDVWRFCPPPADCHPSVMGPVFRSRIFVQSGWKASTRPSAHARTIRTYTLRSE